MGIFCEIFVKSNSISFFPHQTFTSTRSSKQKKRFQGSIYIHTYTLNEWLKDVKRSHHHNLLDSYFPSYITMQNALKMELYNVLNNLVVIKTYFSIFLHLLGNYFLDFSLIEFEKYFGENVSSNANSIFERYSMHPTQIALYFHFLIALCALYIHFTATQLHKQKQCFTSCYFCCFSSSSLWNIWISLYYFKAKKENYAKVKIQGHNAGGVIFPHM